MTLNDALASMTDTMNATKRGAMGGYVWRFRNTNSDPQATTTKNGLLKLSEQDLERGYYYISLVKRNGDQFFYKYGKKPDENIERFIYLGHVDGDSVTKNLDNTTKPEDGEDAEEPQSTNYPNFDGYILTHIGVGYDWTISTQAKLEASRHGSNKW